MVAILEYEVLQVPPATLALIGVVVPEHTFVGPVSAIDPTLVT